MTNSDPPARNWWSLAKQPSGRDLRQKFLQVDEKQIKRTPNAVKSPSGFKSLASAIGLKPKKHHQHPTLAIQEPPSPLLASLHHAFPSSPSSDCGHRPASSTRSRVDSIEPPTPVDSHRDKRNSLLTIADDPFAGRPPMIAVPLPTPLVDPNRLSVYSNPSVHECQRKGDPPTFNRVSYASTSSNSHTTFDSPSPAMTAPPPYPFPEGKKLRPKRSAGSMQAKIPDLLTREPSVTPSISRWSPSNTARSVIEEVLPSRPKLRARGMTDGGHPKMAGFFVQEHPAPSKPPPKPSTCILPPITTTFETLANPRVIVRQASSSRLHAPPTAPPTHSLPATPHSPVDLPNPRQRKGLEESHPTSASASSSSVSLADEYATASYPLFHERRGSSRSYFSHSAQESVLESVDSHSKDLKSLPSSPRTLKKALSQSSLRRAAAPPISKAASDQPIDKRKQQKFHHPRLPIPPIPLPLRPSTSSGTPFPSNTDSGPGPDSKRGSSSSRKRLFSGGSYGRPSTASSVMSAPREDDARSLFSIRSEHDSSHTPYRPWAVTTNFPKPQATVPSSSFWDEEPETTPSSPTYGNVDYLPQAIISRDELARLEASVENSPERPFRSRGFSQTSTSTIASSTLSSVMDELDIDKDLDTDTVLSAAGLSPPPSMKAGRRPTSARASSSRTMSIKSQATTPRRPATADIASRFAILSVPEDTIRPPSSAASTVTMRPPSLHEQTSLPPPPRPRLRSTTSTRSGSSAKTIERPNTATQSSNPRVAFTGRSSASSSPNNSPLIPAATPSSLMRAPSVTVRRSKGSLRLGRTKPPVVLEKTIHRRSIMRKPSFLEIDGDTDAESDSDFVEERRDSLFMGLKGPIAPILPGPTTMNATSSGHGHGAVGVARTGESFLDFARESFDTLRT